jgi:hypothetical protein
MVQQGLRALRQRRRVAVCHRAGGLQLCQQLADGGLLYCSFKYGVDETERDGRAFTQLDEAGLHALITPLPLSEVETWLTADRRPGREQERWLNAIVRKVGS